MKTFANASVGVRYIPAAMTSSRTTRPPPPTEVEFVFEHRAAGAITPSSRLNPARSASMPETTKPPPRRLHAPWVFGPLLLLATLEGLVTAAVLALTAAGLSLVFGIMRVVNVAHGEFFMLGAVIAWFVADAVPGPPALAFAAALVVSPLAVGADRRRRRPPGAEAPRLRPRGDDRRDDRPALHPAAGSPSPSTAPTPARSPPPFELRLQLPGFGYSGYKLAVIAAAALRPRRRLAPARPAPASASSCARPSGTARPRRPSASTSTGSTPASSASAPRSPRSPPC